MPHETSSTDRGASSADGTANRPAVRVLPLTPAHARGVLGVFDEGMRAGNATFETQVPTWDEWDARHSAAHRFVALDGTDGVLGWAAVASVSSRAAYAGVVELSVYVAARAHGRGVGGALVRAVVASTEAAGIWTVQSGVFRENIASLALHERHGFRVVGVRERIGRRDGVWRDVVLLERRSAVVD
ncbi:GNAT family N-acetyltransferase [Cellulomonas sp. NS3]|uniref:GNAT family N-acetyltransferase n=1 Tax=Cellulomonas sp. NS3 TaxID=2973977 RepID=UPI0037C175CE